VSGRDYTGTSYSGSSVSGRARAAGELLLGGWASLVSRLVLGGVFLYAGVSKTLNAGALAAAIRSYELGLPEWFVSISARGLPLLEVVIGVYLLAGLFTRPMALATGGLMLVFFVALLQGAARGLQIDCGCFGGEAGGSNLTLAALRDLGLIALCIQLCLGAPGRFSLDEKLGLSARGSESGKG